MYTHINSQTDRQQCQCHYHQQQKTAAKSWLNGCSHWRGQKHNLASSTGYHTICRKMVNPTNKYDDEYANLQTFSKLPHNIHTVRPASKQINIQQTDTKSVIKQLLNVMAKCKTTEAEAASAQTAMRSILLASVNHWRGQFSHQHHQSTSTQTNMVLPAGRPVWLPEFAYIENDGIGFKFFDLLTSFVCT